MANLLLTRENGNSDALIDAGTIISGSEKIVTLKASNHSNVVYEGIDFFVFDNKDGKTSFSIALGGNGFLENVHPSYIFASTDGITWVEMKGRHSYLSLLEGEAVLNPGEDLTFYLKISIQEGVSINYQEVKLILEGTEKQVE